MASKKIIEPKGRQEKIPIISPNVNFRMHQVLDKDGNCDEKLIPDVSKELMKKMYQLMVQTRTFDETALKLQREGRMLTYASVRGQEASQIGSGLALKNDDWMFPAFRENGVYIVRGTPMHMIYQYWMGDERGMKIPIDQNNFTVAIPVSTQILHAVGTAWGNKMQKKKNASI